MNRFDDGGCVHPIGEFDKYDAAFGMTLWDYYAGQALSGLNSSGRVFEKRVDGTLADKTHRVAAEQATAMIAEKRRRETGDA